MFLSLCTFPCLTVQGTENTACRSLPEPSDEPDILVGSSSHVVRASIPAQKQGDKPNKELPCKIQVRPLSLPSLSRASLEPRAQALSMSLEAAAASAAEGAATARISGLGMSLGAVPEAADTRRPLECDCLL